MVVRGSRDSLIVLLPRPAPAGPLHQGELQTRSIRGAASLGQPCSFEFA